MRFLVDANVAKSVGTVFEDSGHEVLYAQDLLGEGAPDAVICTVAKANNSIVIGHDRDMKALSNQDRYKKLDFIMLYCGNILAAKRVEFMMTLIEHEYARCEEKQARRLFLEIHKHAVRSHR